MLRSMNWALAIVLAPYLTTATANPAAPSASAASAMSHSASAPQESRPLALGPHTDGSAVIAHGPARSVSGQAPAASSELDSHDANTGHSWLNAEVVSAIVSAIATIVIALFTVRLSRSTDLLWGEAKRAGEIAEGSLQIAQQGLELSRRSLEVTQRAFVFFSAFRPEIHKVEGEDHKFRVTGYGFSASFSNSGTTPATHVQLSTQWTKVRPGVVPHFPRPARTVTSVLGPATGGMSQPAYFSVDELAAAFLKKVDLWVWMRVDYRDVFDPSQEHHHEMCGKVSFLLDPTQVPGDGEPPYCGILITGDQNTSG